MFLHWKAPTQLLEYPTWTLNEGLHILLGYYPICEPELKDLTEGFSKKAVLAHIKQHGAEDLIQIHNNEYLIEIANGQRVESTYGPSLSQDDETEIPEQLSNLFKIIDLWKNSQHDTSQCEDIRQNLPTKQRWRKEYFVHWGAKHDYKMDWLLEVKGAGYMSEYQQHFSAHPQSRFLTGDEPNWHVFPQKRNNADAGALLHACLQLMRAEKILEKPSYTSLCTFVQSGKIDTLRFENSTLKYQQNGRWYAIKRENAAKMIRNKIGDGPFPQ